MNPAILESLLGALASIAGVSALAVVQPLIRRFLRRPTEQRRTFGERLQELTSSLTKASRDADEVLTEISSVAAERQAAVAKLTQDLQQLEFQEQQLKGRIDALQRTPLAVAEHFAELIASGEKRSARRDYMLFGAGVLVSTVLSIIIQLAS